MVAAAAGARTKWKVHRRIRAMLSINGGAAELQTCCAIDYGREPAPLTQKRMDIGSGSEHFGPVVTRSSEPSIRRLSWMVSIRSLRATVRNRACPNCVASKGQEGGLR